MKLLFDQNISHRIVKRVESIFSESQQVRGLGLENASDLRIFEFAKTNGFTLVTFDSDFVDLNILRKAPPKIIWIRTGNLTTNSIAELLINKSIAIQHFLNDQAQEVLEIW